MVSVTNLSLVLNQLKSSLAHLSFRPYLNHVKRRQPNTSSHCEIIYASRFHPSSTSRSSLWSSLFATSPPSLPSPSLDAAHLVTPQYVAPRAPIVLCHGLYGFDKRGPDALPFLQVRYWGGIENALARLGAKVVVTKVPRTGSIKARAKALHSFLNLAIQNQPVNFIAHSMGGLDCRYLLSHLHDRSYKPLSLTTVSTPHRGSPLTNWFRKYVGVAKMTDDMFSGRSFSASPFADPETLTIHGHTPNPGSMAAHSLDRPLQKLVHQYLDTPAYANLTTDFCQGYFNPNTPDHPDVAYYSYGSNVVLPFWSVLGLPNQLIRDHEGDNDGIVSVQSAQWGKYIKTLDAHHWALNGQRYPWLSTSRSSSTESNNKFDTIEFYLELATFLYRQGH
ncbi:alpha/beta-hydrolase [Hesseltinella vesiculosa]|uniref:Alpha/beta-hydrolase n=1 Tax=Hesseltinella vesiculosa TaxID=101127 RepID=A0A1X2G8L4_9FUNG|nr:alpha/beta-hydrolase [Hesseltinella vesiculosa]